MRRVAVFVMTMALLCCLCCARLACAEDSAPPDSAPLPPAYPVPDYVVWLLDVARAELGYTEASDGRTKYGEWAGDAQAEWCAEFLCWCVSQVDETRGTNILTVLYPRYSGQNVGLRWFLREGRYIARTGRVQDWGSQWYIGDDEKLPSAGYVPQPGDWVFYAFDSSGNTAHVAMVEYCTRDEGGVVTVHVIEGNMPDRVQRNTHLLDDWRVLGYGTVHELADIVMQSGNEGKKVLALQRRLSYLGYLDAQYATGVYGPSTVKAVKAFQAANDKTPTGIANQHTQLTMNEQYLAASWQDDGLWQVGSE